MEHPFQIKVANLYKVLLNEYLSKSIAGLTLECFSFDNLEEILLLIFGFVVILLADGFTRKNLRLHNGIYNVYYY